MRTDRWVGLAVALACLVGAGCSDREGRVIPLSSSSEKALELFREGRAAQDALRLDEAYALYQQAVREDPDFALAHLGLAECSSDREESRNHLQRAMLRSKTITEGERLLIRAVHAHETHNLNAEFEYLNQAAHRYPDDERARVRLGDFYLRRENAPEAIRNYEQALELAPDWAVPYRRLADAYRGVGKFAKAEESMEKYLKAYPSEPSAHDLYGRLLMKTGRFEDSMAAYGKALALDASDTDAQIGIGYDLLFLDRGPEAIETFRKMLDQASDDDTRIEVQRWLVAAYVDQQASDKALAELQQAYDAVDAKQAPVDAAEILELMGDVMLESGDTDGAMKRFDTALELIEGAALSDYDKQLWRGRHLYYEARAALAKGKVESARDKMMEYRRIVGEQWIPGAGEKFNELSGLTELAEGSPQTAIRRLLLAGKKNPRIMYLTALAYREFDERKAKTMYQNVVNFNEPNFELAFVRSKARQQLENL